MPNEHPLEHSVKQQAIMWRFPCLLLQRGLTACRACAVIQHAVPVPIPRFQVWGWNLSQGIFFGFFPSPNFLQRSINGEYLSNNLIDWLIDTSCHWSHITKMILTGIRTPHLETWNCLTQCSNGCSLGSLLFPRQDNHVQRCARNALFHKTRLEVRFNLEYSVALMRFQMR